MSAKSQTLAKSLHTVSVLVNVARALAPANGMSNWPTIMDNVLYQLGYLGAADPHGLAAKAVAILRAGK